MGQTPSESPATTTTLNCRPSTAAGVVTVTVPPFVRPARESAVTSLPDHCTRKSWMLASGCRSTKRLPTSKRVTRASR
ncbi:hypothetical protein ACFPRL_29655 [Pseudoclavibacter helvolus]